MKTSRIVVAGFGFAAPVIIAMSAFAIDLPARKPGLWELTMTSDGAAMPPQTMQHCIDEATDKEMMEMSNSIGAQQCQQNWTKTATGFAFESTCDFGGGKTASRGTVTGDFNSAYQIDMISKGGPRGANEETRMNMAAKWLGACKAGQKPGDIVMPGGMKINVSQMKKMMGAMPGAKPPAR